MNIQFVPLNQINVDYIDLNKYLAKFSKEISELKTTIAERDKVVKLCVDLIIEVNNCRKKSATTLNMNKICDEIHMHTISELNNINSKYKRDKIMKKSFMYVEPVEMSSGFEFVKKIDKKSGESIRTTIQRTFQYVSPLKTLKALFGDEKFVEMYIKFNQNDNHKCTEGVFDRFCCGHIYQNSNFFKSNPLALQLKFFVDDFEPCDALKSKAGKHKTTAYYMQINNLPQKYLYKVNSIYLVALCDASDAKSEYTNPNNVLETIVTDIKFLEKKGIKTKGGLIIKGSLMCAMYDNLGGNILLGLHGSFNSNHYCRICLATKQQCQEMTKEDPDLLRTVDNYNQCVTILNSDSKVKDTKGIKEYCHLNDLQHFHIMKNISVDFMHDILEGLIPFTLEHIFNYCVTKKIATVDQIQGMIDCYNFGELDKFNKPSKINLDRKNLGQNASQSYCLFTNLPFILFKFREKLHCVWAPVETLQQILQIVYSYSIKENDLSKLEILVHKFLEAFKQLFGVNLRPKHHFLLHYVRVIRMMGPVVFFWVMRMESKHQFFKKVAQKTKNYINLKKSMAYQHQESLYHAANVYTDEIKVSKKVNSLKLSIDYETYAEVLEEEFAEIMIEEALVVNSVEINNNKYKSDSLILFGSVICEIEYIVTHNNQFWAFCSYSYCIKEYNTFLNSFLLERFEKFRIINILELKNIRVYEKKYLKGNPYLVVVNLELYSLFQ